MERIFKGSRFSTGVPMVLVALVLLTMLAFPAGAAVTLTPVVATNADEWGPAAGTGGIAWNRYTRRDYWILADTGGGPFRVNPAGTWAWTGSIEGDVLTYQQVDRRGSDIVAFDLATKTPLTSPAHVNSRWWEYFPSASGSWVLFARTNVGFGARREWRRVYLVDTITGERRLLTSGPKNAILWPGQVSGNWAAWHECKKTGCFVYLHDIAADTTTKIPQGGSDQYSPAVSSDGTLYYMRAGSRCGSHVMIIKRTSGGTESTLYSFPKGIDAEGSYVFDGATQDLYFQDVDCADDYVSDIYKITSADTVAAPLATIPVQVETPADSEISGRTPTDAMERAARMGT